MPYNTVDGSQGKVNVNFRYASESDPGPYPIPANPAVEYGSDGHLFVIDRTNCVDYELYEATRNADGSWSAGSGAIFPLNSNQLRPAGWTSTDAAGLPVFPGLLRYDEVASGVLNHAIRFTAPYTANSYVWPARHEASWNSGPQFPPMGTRFRLKAAFNVSLYPKDDQVILNAMKKYGVILADNGASWFFGGVTDPRWNDDELHLLTYLSGANFEAVDESSLMVDVNSAEANNGGSSSPSPSVPVNQWVSIVSQNSGKCLEASSTARAGVMQQWTCTGAPNQQFMFSPVPGGFQVTVQSTGMQLDVRGGPSAKGDGIVVLQWPFYGGSNEIWKVTADATSGYVNLHPLNSGKCLDVSNVSSDNGAVVWQWSCTGVANQAWKVQ